MEQIVECVPNFSTADKDIIAKISSEIKSVDNIKLLNVEPDEAYNRVVVTFVGTPERIGEAAFLAIQKATELIDMTSHKGEHPRLGACDVTPLIPVRGVTVETCIEISKTLAKKIAEELKVPTYLYGRSATSPERTKLSDIRKGQYEGLAEKIKDPNWTPDFGEPIFNERSGAYVIGVRDFLVAYNVNVDEAENVVAKEIGPLIRESGRLVEKDGEKVRIPGKFKGVQGMGFPLERDGRKLTQVSMNLLDFKNKTGLHEVFDEVKSLAEDRGVQITGSEIVGLVPLEAILIAGRHYSPDETDQNKLIQAAISNLGLSDLEKFNPNKKIIELMIDAENLSDLSVDEFLSSLSSDAPAPGGGSVSALGASLSAALISMVANLTIGKDKFQDVEDEMKGVLKQASQLGEALKVAIDEDTEAFNAVMQAFRMKKDDTGKRSLAIQEAMIYAAEVPLNVAASSRKLLKLAKFVAEKGNKNAITDTGVAVLFTDAAIRGALLNVKINLSSIKDATIVSTISEKIKEIEENLELEKNKIMEIVNCNL